MKRYLLLLVMAFIFFYSCNTPKKNLNTVLNQDYLPSQNFSLNINRDTVLVTKSKCIIKIPKGSLESETENIKLEIKEALTNTDIVLAGLTTVSGQQSLSSGGMLYINAADGYKISIKKELEVLVPTKDYNPGMNVYKGEDSAGKINWTAPEPLPDDSILLKIKAGKQLFMANCANCHKPALDLAGPALAGITKRRSLQWIYHFIHNPAAMNDEAARFIKYKWRPTLMTAFPVLSDTAINYILAYIETANDRKWNRPLTSFLKDSTTAEGKACIDSCNKYLQALEEAENKKYELESDNSGGDFFSLDQTIPVPPQTTSPATINTNPAPQSTPPATVNKPVTQTEDPSEPETEQPKFVYPTEIKATFYTVNIKAFGWYNIDILLKEQSNCSPSELFVRLQGTYEQDFQVMLIVPSVKAFVQGGKSDDEKLYAFNETNGNIPLPQNAQCYVIAFTEADGKLIFGKAAFSSTLKQTVDISLSETTKEKFQEEIKSLNLDGIDATVTVSKKDELTKSFEKISTEAERLKPKNCDCGIPKLDAIDSTAPRLANK